MSKITFGKWNCRRALWNDKPLDSTQFYRTLRIVPYTLLRLQHHIASHAVTVICSNHIFLHEQTLVGDGGFSLFFSFFSFYLNENHLWYWAEYVRTLNTTKLESQNSYYSMHVKCAKPYIVKVRDSRSKVEKDIWEVERMWESCWVHS